MSGVFRLLVMASPGLNQVPSAMNQGPLKIKQTAGWLFYSISSDDLSRDWFPLIQKPDSRMNVIGDIHVLAALRDSVMTSDSYHTRAHTVQAHGQTE